MNCLITEHLRNYVADASRVESRRTRPDTVTMMLYELYRLGLPSLIIHTLHSNLWHVGNGTTIEGARTKFQKPS